MKNLKTLLLTFAVIFLSSCSLDDTTSQSAIPDSLRDLLEKDQNFTSLIEAFEAADTDLLETLSNLGSYTLLAPTNAAFETYLDGRTLDEIPDEDLKQILLYHIIPGSIKSTDTRLDQKPTGNLI